jgi:transposase
MNNTNTQRELLPHNKAKNESAGAGRKATLRAKAPSAKPIQPAEVIKVGLDMGLKNYAVCRQVDGSLPDAAQVKSPAQFRIWLLQQKELSRRVVVCYEAGLFGFELARWILDQQMECLVMAPVKLDESNKRVETDKLNAQDICSRLDRYLAGNTRALTVCRNPKRQEELARHQTRLRQQLLDHRKALEAQGRCLLWQFGYLEEGSDWWQALEWDRLSKSIPEPEIRSGLSRLRAVILPIVEQLKTLTEELAKQAQRDLPPPLSQNLPLGVGWLSMLILTREVMDWGRFTNRRQMGGFGGLVPSESSTGQSVRRGSITKVGNPVIRTILVEMAWRLVRYQPDCRAIRRWKHILTDKKAGASIRKKAIVAAARVLGVDLWRVATGATTFQKLGFIGIFPPSKDPTDPIDPLSGR